MNSWFDDSDQEYGIDTSGMKLFYDESLEFEIPMNSISKDTLAKLIGGVPIIRCKDCKYYTGKWCTKYSTKQFDINDIYKADDDFCSMAERRDNELRFKNCR